MIIKVYTMRDSGKGDKKITILKLEPGMSLDIEGARIDYKKPHNAYLTILERSDQVPMPSLNNANVPRGAELKLRQWHKFKTYYLIDGILYIKKYIILNLQEDEFSLSPDEARLVELIGSRADELNWNFYDRNYSKSSLYDEVYWSYQTTTVIAALKGVPYRVELKKVVESYRFKQPYDPDADFYWYEMRIVDYGKYNPKTIHEIIIQQYEKEVADMDKLYIQINSLINDTELVEITVAEIVKNIDAG